MVLCSVGRQDGEESISNEVEKLLGRTADGLLAEDRREALVLLSELLQSNEQVHILGVQYSAAITLTLIQASGICSLLMNGCDMISCKGVSSWLGFPSSTVPCKVCLTIYTADISPYRRRRCWA